MEQVIFTEESMRLGEPPEVNGMGINMVGPMLMHYGTAEQRTRYLRNILSAAEIWCQGFSEPGSGSDLASLSTRRGKMAMTSGSGANLDQNAMVALVSCSRAPIRRCPSTKATCFL
jgi:hypothetical protein